MRNFYPKSSKISDLCSETIIFYISIYEEALKILVKTNLNYFILLFQCAAMMVVKSTNGVFI